MYYNNLKIEIEEKFGEMYNIMHFFNGHGYYLSGVDSSLIKTEQLDVSVAKYNYGEYVSFSGIELVVLSSFIRRDKIHYVVGCVNGDTLINMKESEIKLSRIGKLKKYLTEI